MSARSLKPLWAIRDNRTLSEHAKLAYVMLWSRGETAFPSLKTLAADMSVGRATAKRAVRELEVAGCLKRIQRRTESRPNLADTNLYELIAPDGWGQCDPTWGQEDPTPGVRQTPEVTTLKIESEGRESRASRLARPAVFSDSERVTLMRITVAEHYGDAIEQDLSDRRALELWDNLAKGITPDDPVAWFGKIFEDTPHLETHLQYTEPDLAC